MRVKEARAVEPETVEGAPGVLVRWLLTEKDGANNFNMRVFEIEPGRQTEHHRHAWEHEVFVLSGKGKVWSESGEQEIGPEQVVLVAPQELHHFASIGDTPLKFICCVPNKRYCNL